jgi:DNA polymerase-3 subunit epsilon
MAATAGPAFAPALDFQRLAFVDVETTGLDPTTDRIAEIGVVTIDEDVACEWGTFIALKRGAEPRAPRAGAGSLASRPETAPTFKDIAVELERRLAGRLLIAHNARFDYAFLRAEFGRAGIAFDAPVLCTVMLSRRLYAQHAAHDLDALIERHGVAAAERHRALSDARALHACWFAMQRENGLAAIADAVAELRAGPVLPAHLDPALIDRLPESPGVYVLHGASNEILRVGVAANLRLHLIDYFRLDRLSAHASAISHRIENITWRVTQGMLGARVQRIALANVTSESRKVRHESVLSWRATPDRCPALELVPIERDSLSSGSELFGMFDSIRKARNALRRLSRRHALCHATLGLPSAACACCCACADAGRACGEKTERLRHLVKCFVALRPLRVSPWPYPGPIVVRERRDLHVFNAWRYLGTANTESEVREMMNARPGELDKVMYAYLVRSLPRIPPEWIYRGENNDSSAESVMSAARAGCAVSSVSAVPRAFNVSNLRKSPSASI